MIQTLHALSQSNPIAMGAPARAPSKPSDGGFALLLQTAPDQLSSAPTTTPTAQAPAPVAPGVNLARLMLGADQITHGTPGETSPESPEITALKTAEGAGQVDTVLPTVPALPPVVEGVSPPTAPSGISADAPTTPGAEALTTDGTVPALIQPQTGEGQTAMDGAKADSSQQDVGTAEVAEQVKGVDATVTTNAPSEALTASARADGTTSDRVDVTKGSGPTPSITRPAETASPQEAAKDPGLASQAGTAMDPAETSKPLAPDTKPDAGPVQTIAQTAERNAGQHADGQPGHDADQPKADTGKRPASSEGAPPAPTLVAATGAVPAPSAAQFDMTQQTSANQGGPTLDVQDPQWTRDLGLIAEDIMRTGAGELELKLNPEKLGAMTLRIDMIDGRASVTIVTETPEAAKLMMDNQFRLSEQMQRSGFDLNQTVSHNASSGGSEGQSSRRGTAAGSHGMGQSEDQQDPGQDTGAPRSQSRSGVDLVA